MTRKCTQCGELTGSKKKQLCPTCDYNNLPVAEATEMLYARTLESCASVAHMKEFSYVEDISLEELQLVNTVEEERDLIAAIENWLDYYICQFDDPDDIDIPTSLLVEIEKFCHTLPKLYTPVKTRPKLEDL